MSTVSSAGWVIGICTLLTFIISFAVFYSETQEPISSFSAALLGGLLMLGSLIVLGWIVRLLKK